MSLVSFDFFCSVCFLHFLSFIHVLFSKGAIPFTKIVRDYLFFKKQEHTIKPNDDYGIAMGTIQYDA